MKQKELKISILSEPAEVIVEQNRNPDDLNCRETMSTAELSSHLSHKLKNSLAVIASATEQITESSLSSIDPGDQDFLDAVLGASDKINDTINRFMQLVDPPKIYPEQIDINELCRAGISIACEDNKFPLSGQMIEFEKPSLEVEVDPNMIRTLLSNLFSNALQNMSDEDQLRVKTKKVKNEAVITITNNARKIKQKTMQSMFLPFFSTQPGQLGLGLPIASRIAADHNGSIKVETCKSDGSDSSTGNGQPEIVKFIVSLPLRVRGGSN